MIIILIYWFFLFLFFLPAGLFIRDALQIDTRNPMLLQLLGIFFYSAAFTCTALFFPLGGQVLVFWIAAGCMAGAFYRKEMVTALGDCIKMIKILPVYFKLASILLVAAALLKCAQSPFILDNEGYYIQTIKWLNEYGLVKGVSNLHSFFAQHSTWHILQAGVNFNFLTNRINDINGFLLIIGTLYCFTEACKFIEGRKVHWLGMVPLFTILMMQFINVPSPDFPLIILTPILLHLYIQSKDDNSYFKVAFILFLLIATIKVTCLPLGILFLPGLTQRKNVIFMFATAFGTLIIWAAKNTIVSGYPLYPIPYMAINVDWKMHEDLIKYVIGVASDYGYLRHGKLPAGTPMHQKIMLWLQQDKMAGIMNYLSLAALLIMPFTNAVRKNKQYKLMYIALLINFVTVLLTGPQFRYFMHITIMSAAFVIAVAYNYLKMPLIFYKTMATMGIAFAYIVFLDVDLTSLTTNRYNSSTGSFRVSQLYIPECNTKLPEMKFEVIKDGNLQYHSPEKHYMYGTSDGRLPCTNQRMIQRLKDSLGIVPQLRGTTLADGFYSAKLEDIRQE